MMEQPFKDAQWISIHEFVESRRREKRMRWWFRRQPVPLNKAPLFRREVVLEAPPRSATIDICGLGYYELWINELRVGDRVLDLAQTDYEHRVFYISYEILNYLQCGANCIGVLVS